MWSRPFDSAALEALIDSPARKTVSAALGRGEAAVWVLLECGDAVLDETAVDNLSTHLKQLEVTLSAAPAGPGYGQWRIGARRKIKALASPQSVVDCYG